MQQDKNDFLIDVINKVCIDIKTHETNIVKIGGRLKNQNITNTTLWCERICEKYDVHKFPSKQKINISLKKKRPHRQGTNM